MSSVSQYFKGLFGGIGALLTGMSVTIKELFSKKVTQQYPENRKTLVMSDRFRGELNMPHDENNEHACTSCGICEMNCPNGTIRITSKMIETEDGKKKKILDTYYYNLGMCTFCNLCVITCPSDAIKFDNIFENAIFTRAKLNMKLNHEGSKLREKKKPAPAPKPAVEKPVEAKAEVEKPSAEKPAEAPVDKPQATVVEPKPVVEKTQTDEKPVSEKPMVEDKVVEAKPAMETPVRKTPIIEKITPEQEEKPVARENKVDAPADKPQENKPAVEDKPTGGKPADGENKRRYI